jgi:hypothetical protein
MAIHPEGVKETLHPTNILIDGSNVAMQLDAEFTFSKDMPDYFLGSFKKGDDVISKLGLNIIQ